MANTTRWQGYLSFYNDKEGGIHYFLGAFFQSIFVSHLADPQNVQCVALSNGSKKYSFDVPIYGAAWSLNRLFDSLAMFDPEVQTVVSQLKKDGKLFSTDDESAIYLHCSAFMRKGDSGRYLSGDSFSRALTRAGEQMDTSIRASMTGKLSLNVWTDKNTGELKMSGLNLLLDDFWPIYNVSQTSHQASNSAAAGTANGFAQAPMAPHNGFAQAPQAASQQPYPQQTAQTAPPQVYSQQTAQTAPPQVYPQQAPQTAPPQVYPQQAPQTAPQQAYPQQAPQTAPQQAYPQQAAPQQVPQAPQAPRPMQNPAGNAGPGFQTGIPGVQAISTNYDDSDLPF